jgi:iron complex transport system ATP-binding protein
MIVVRNLTKAYGEHRVVRDVSFEIPRGGVTSIIGPNGAGKSTLLSLVSRLLPATGGSVHVDDLDIARAPSDILARRLAILRQENVITARLTVRELVEFGRFPHSRGRLTAEDRQRAQDAIDYLDLRELSDRFIDEMSGGQRQRAFVAMVLCQDADYVLMDEPLNSLDMKHAAAMMRLIRKISDERGKTFVVVLHDINFASNYSDRIMAMRDGELIRQGTPSEIMQSRVLREIFDIDVPIHEIDGRRVAMYYGYRRGHRTRE